MAHKKKWRKGYPGLNRRPKMRRDRDGELLAEPTMQFII